MWAGRARSRTILVLAYIRAALPQATPVDGSMALHPPAFNLLLRPTGSIVPDTAKAPQDRAAMGLLHEGCSNVHYMALGAARGSLKCQPAALSSGVPALRLAMI